MEVFTGLKLSALLSCPMSLRKYKDMKALYKARMKEITDIALLHTALEQIHKEVAESSMLHSTHALRFHFAKANVFPLHISVGDYFMRRGHAKRENKLQSKWGGPMRVKVANSSLVYVLEDLIDARQLFVQAQRTIPYPVTKKEEH